MTLQLVFTGSCLTLSIKGTVWRTSRSQLVVPFGKTPRDPPSLSGKQVAGNSLASSQLLERHLATLNKDLLGNCAMLGLSAEMLT